MLTPMDAIVAAGRVILIVALSVAVGVAVALASSNLEGDSLQVVGLFAIFAAPMAVAWFFFRIIPPVRRRVADERIVGITNNGECSQDANSQRPLDPEPPGQPPANG